MPINYNKLEEEIHSIPPLISHELQRELSGCFDKCGIYYRLFIRTKSSISTITKIKNKKYEESGRKMQDILGARIVLYFKDDIDICVEIIKKKYDIVEIVRDEETSDTFSPRRLNIVCKMSEKVYGYFSKELWMYPIDNTFEIQIRTIFSEGWHEVEHDLRYKNQTDWTNSMDLSRNLNGIFATLETCDWAILNVTDSLAYQKYKAKDWESMIRNHLRIHMDGTPLSNEIKQIFNEDLKLAKDFYRVDRQSILVYLSDENMFVFPNKMDNYIFLINELLIKNDKISDITPSFLKEKVKIFSK